MGCSNGNNYININQNILIKLCLKLYKNEININNSIQESLYDDSKLKTEMYYLVNKFWKEDFLDFFNYNEIKNIIIDLIGKEYHDVNVEGIDSFLGGNNFKLLIEDNKIQEKIGLIRSKSITHFPKELKAISHIKNNFIKLNKDKETYPDNNTALLEKEIFDLMIKLLNDSSEDKKVNKEELDKIVFHSQVLLGNENIYIKIKDNEIIICFLEDEKLRTKYFMYFNKEKCFEEIIKKYILNKSLETHIEYNYDMLDISEREMNDGENKIGFFLNLIPIEKDENNKKLQSKSLISEDNKGAPPLYFEGNKKGNYKINKKENNTKSCNVKEDKKINKNGHDNKNNITNNKNENSLIEINYGKELIKKKNDNNNSVNDISKDMIFNPKDDNIIEDNDLKNNNDDKESINFISNENNQKYDTPYNSENKKNDKNLLIEDSEDSTRNPNNKILRRIQKMGSNIVNDVFQCLINIEIIRDFFIVNENKIKSENKNIAAFCKRFIHTIKFVNNNNLQNNENILDEEFFKKNNYNPNNDIVSFLSLSFKKFKEELKGLDLYINDRCIDKFFFGGRNIECICNYCGQNFRNNQPFFYLKFDLPQIFQYYTNINPHIMNINLIDCFNYSFRFGEELTCDKCGKNNYTVKSYKIDKLPDIIIIILEKGQGAPFTHKFMFDSTALVKDKEKTYYCLVSQIGQNERETLITHLKSLDDLEWRECKENNIVECNENDVKSKVPYVLFYQKVQDLDKIRLIDENDNSVILHENDNIDLMFYSTVTRVKEKLEHLDSNFTIGYIYSDILCKKYKLENKNNRVLFFSNSRLLDYNKSIKDNNLDNNDFVIIVEYNYS